MIGDASIAQFTTTSITIIQFTKSQPLIYHHRHYTSATAANNKNH